MIVVDSCVLIAHLEAGDPHSREALEILDTEDALLVHPLTLSECFVGAIRAGQEGAFRSAITRIGIDVWQPDAEHPFRSARWRVENRLKLPDACILDAAQHNAATLATFDAALAAAARRLTVPVVGTGPGWET